MSEVVIHEVAGMLILQKTKKLKVSIQTRFQFSLYVDQLGPWSWFFSLVLGNLGLGSLFFLIDFLVDEIHEDFDSVELWLWMIIRYIQDTTCTSSFL